MINRKMNIVLCSILGLVLTTGVMEMPVLADGGVKAVSAYSESNNTLENMNFIVSKDNTIEQNGLKISIDKVVASKHELKATVKVEGQKAFDKTDDHNVRALLTYGDNKENGSSMSDGTTNDKTLEITLGKEVDEGEIPEKGNLRIDLIIPKYKINVGIEADVDFSESFKSTIEKEVEVKVPECNFTVKKIESNIFGTEITYSGQEKEDSKGNGHMLRAYSTPFILKVGDKMYTTMNDGESSIDNVITGTYKAAAATYDKVKGQNNMSIIPLVCTMTDDETEKFYENNYKNIDKKKEDNKETTNNVRYTKNFEFSDGTKGEVYNIERNANSVKVYCKGATEKESLLMASTACIYYKVDKGQEYFDHYFSTEHMSFYKDPKNSLGYIVEFADVNNNKEIELNFDGLISQIDKYKIGDEIQLSK